MQYAIFPLRHTWISQGMNGKTSHVGTKAIDFGWLSAYRDFTLYAPFDGHIVWVDSPSKGGAIAFQSDAKVKFANGREEYMTLITAHDNNPPTIGSAFKQGQIYSHMGTAGGVGKHCHMEVQLGKFQMYNDFTPQGYYKFPNTIEPYNGLWLTDDTFIDQNASVVWYTWKVLLTSALKEKDESVPQVKVVVDELRVRADHSTFASLKGYAVRDGIYDYSETYEDDVFTWYEIGENEWIADNGNWLEVNDMTKDEEIRKLKEENAKLTMAYNNLLEKYDRQTKELNANKEKKNEYKTIIKKAKKYTDKASELLAV